MGGMGNYGRLWEIMGEMGGMGHCEKPSGITNPSIHLINLPQVSLTFFLGGGSRRGLYYSAFILARASSSFSSLAQSDMRI